MPVLLICWAETGPGLLRAIHATRTVPDVPTGAPEAVPATPEVGAGTVDERPTPDPSPDTAPVPAVASTGERMPDRPAPPAPLVDAARRLAAEHHATTGRPLTADGLRARLPVSHALAGDLLARLRADPAT
jgi:hypothetical protein